MSRVNSRRNGSQRRSLAPIDPAHQVELVCRYQPGIVGIHRELAGFGAIAAVNAGLQIHHDVTIQLFQNDVLGSPDLLISVDLRMFCGLPEIGQCLTKLAERIHVNHENSSGWAQVGHISRRSNRTTVEWTRCLARLCLERCMEIDLSQFRPPCLRDTGDELMALQFVSRHRDLDQRERELALPRLTKRKCAACVSRLNFASVPIKRPAHGNREIDHVRRIGIGVRRSDRLAQRTVH